MNHPGGLEMVSWKQYHGKENTSTLSRSKMNILLLQVDGALRVRSFS